MGERLRRFGNWRPWAISALGLVCVIAAYFLDPDMARYSFWLTVLTSGGIALALAAPVTMLTRNLADDIAVDVADANALEEDEIVDAIEERTALPDLGETVEGSEGTDPAATPAADPGSPESDRAPATPSYPELADYLKDQGWAMTSTGAMHEVWRNGRARVVIPRDPKDPDRVFEQIRRRADRGGRLSPEDAAEMRAAAARRRTGRGGPPDPRRGRPNPPQPGRPTPPTQDGS